ncbi:hypothetical protein ASPACDRAFT_1887530 [Aspergillus aculeatus ATCC 16872]|uniref:CST complex subunit Stn1 N-terminal domain-containing protein n=1 Tax=Aspergillus aculeatus (strain ATCC 16872 / CBS 172.66 / WB 5094) TaxID=690307 RepID=A0A1L9WY17_ASPA1|nr:uncharacterized protein ASPACDRAFT_1887530 [Aspergillus aculeatus ATCC 16872]OJK00778.1 hypothetical protein ASPACDRAFT_1887530 [Aspergillus aculeatus ATCC 16872]
MAPWRPPEPDPPEFYPAYCFQASPTHFSWVKMAVADVRQLHRRPEYPEGIFFHKNHPIRFIAVAGLITARTEYPRVTVLTLDDSSGAVLDVVVQKPDPVAEPIAPAEAAAAPAPAAAVPSAVRATTQTERQAQRHIAPTTLQALDIQSLIPGALAHLKGTLSTYRKTVQLQLERCGLLGGVNAEMRFLDQRNRVRVEVLDAPWVLGEEEVARLRREMVAEEEKGEAEVARVRRRLRRRGEREERDTRKIWERWELEEGMREREAAVVRGAGVELMRVLRGRRLKRVGGDDGDGDGPRKRGWGE